MRRALWAVVIAVPLLIVLALGFGRNPNSISSPLLGKSASSFALQSEMGSRLVSLRSLRGKPVILNFWASWCVDCKVEHGNLETAWRLYGHDVQFVGISYQDATSDARRFMREFGGGWPILRDPGQRTAIDYGVYGVPETFFIDRNGVVKYKSIGPVSWGDLQRHIRTLLGRNA